MTVASLSGSTAIESTSNCAPLVLQASVTSPMEGMKVEEQEEIDLANEAYKGKIEIRRSEGRGWGLFAMRDFAPGDVLMQSKVLEIFNKPTSHSIQSDWDRHFQVNLPARFINHYCNQANVGIQMRSDGCDFFALCEIRQGEELMWDYETTEYELTESFECNCGSSTCRGKVKGFRFSHDQVLDAYGPKYVAPYLLQWLQESKAKQSTVLVEEAVESVGCLHVDTNTW